MTYKEVTITSKNQITIPSIYTKELNITKGSVLKASVQGNKIILTSTDKLSSKLKSFWPKNTKVHLSDNQLNKAIQQSVASRASKK